MDEYCMQQIKEFEGFKLCCVTKEGLNFDDLNEDEQKQKDSLVSHYSGLCETIKDIIGDKVEKVVVSNRISTSPACLVTGEYGWTANMERIMKAQALRDSSMSSYMSSKKILELNPKNSIIKELRRRSELDRADKILRDLSYLLYELTLLISGFSLENPCAFGKRVTRMLELGLSIENNEPTNNDSNLTDETKWVKKDPGLELID